ncbi:MAG: S8 family serine peptidase [Salibacteraceae bacterium]
MKLRLPIRGLGALGLFVCMSVSSLEAQEIQNPHHLLLRSGDFAFPNNIENALAQSAVDADEIFNNHYYRVLQFHVIPGEAEKAALKQQGIHLLDYLPRNAWLVAIEENANLSQLATLSVRGILPVLPRFKMTKNLFEGEYPVWALSGKGRIQVNVTYFGNVTAPEAKELFKNQGWKIPYTNDFGRYLTLELPIAELADLTALPAVQFIEPIDPPSEAENYTARTLHRSNSIATEFSTGRHYDGTGVSVMMQDDGVIGPHIDYQGRLPDQYPTFNNGDHGDHVAGIIMGAGNINPQNRGMAFGADLYVYGAAPSYPGFDSISNANHYNTKDIVITSTSYSNGCNAGYTSLARTMDLQVSTYDALMHVFSAGNSGTSDCGYGAGNTWGNITGGHKIGKNVIAVANLNLNDDLANSSSRGPAHDGRIKPDVAAKGTAVISTTDVNSYVSKTGTSMSCPGTSGTLAQLYQAYRDLNGGNDPTGGLMKAVMLNSCDDLGNEGPDFKFGWGRINGLRAVRTLEQNHYMSGTISSGGSNQHTITVPGGTQYVKIMVYWTDAAASANASQALVNNLDMVVTDPNTNTHLPWVLDPTPNTQTLDNPATTGVDNLNNVEQVAIVSPMSGTYTIDVSGSSVPSGPQDYYVIYEFIGESIDVTYPIGGEPLVPFENEQIRWDAYGTTGNFTLEYSSDAGATWNNISSSVPGNQRTFSWTVPNIVTGQAMVRVSRGAVSDESDTTFTIIRVPTGLTVNYVCPDSLGLSWNNVNGATSYEVSMLGQKYMDAVGTSSTTSFVMYHSNPYEDRWFSVKALGPNGIVGRRAVAIFRAGGVVNCNIAFDAELEAFITPTGGATATCETNFDTPISLAIHHPGATNIWNIPVSYQIGTQPVVTDTFPISINPGMTDTVTFSVNETFTSGFYNLSAWVNFGLDQNNFNDTLNTTLDVITGNTVTLPWSEDFESFALCNTDGNCELGVCQLSNGFINDVNQLGDDIDWRTDNDGTNTGNTGPSVDHTLGNGGGRYLYTEATLGNTGCQFSQANLITPCIDLVNATNPSLCFWYHMFGNNMGDLHVDVKSNGLWVNDVTPVISGNQGDAWLNQIVDLSAYTGEIINIRFRGVTGGGFRSDIALDDIAVNEGVSAGFNSQEVGQFTDFQFTNQSQGGLSYLWSFGDGNTSTLESPFHSYGQKGIYQVTLIVDNGCQTDTITQEVAVIPTDVAEAVENNALLLEVFPNPSQGLFNYELPQNSSETVEIEVTDVTGRVILRESLVSTKTSNGQIDLSQEAAGIYYLKVTSGDREEQLKLSVL